MYLKKERKINTKQMKSKNNKYKIQWFSAALKQVAE